MQLGVEPVFDNAYTHTLCMYIISGFKHGMLRNYMLNRYI